MPGRQASADAYAELVLSMNPVVYYRMEDGQRGRTTTVTSWSIRPLAPTTAYCIRTVASGRGSGAHSAVPWIFTGRESATMPSCRTIPRRDNDQLSASAWVWPVLSDRLDGDRDELVVEPDYKGDSGQFFLGICAEQNLMAAVHDQDGKEVERSRGGRKSRCAVACGTTWHLWPTERCCGCITTASRWPRRRTAGFTGRHGPRR